MFDNKFCEYLEFAITKALSNSVNPKTKGFWCDGILLPDIKSTDLKKNINDIRRLELTAFLGADGQEKYNMIVHFGNKSLSKNARGLDLEQCVPVEDNSWIIIDAEKKEIEIRLD